MQCFFRKCFFFYNELFFLPILICVDGLVAVVCRELASQATEVIDLVIAATNLLQADEKAEESV